MRRPSASQEMVNSGSRSRMYEELSADLSVSSQTQTTRTHIPAPPPIHQEMSFTAGDDGRARRGSTTNDAHNGTLRDEFTLGSMIMSPRQIMNALRGLLGGGNQSSSDLASAVGGDLNGSSSTNGRPLPASSTSRHKKKTRNVRELLEAPKVNVYSVPPNTYYVRRNPPPTDAAAAALRRSTSVLSIESNAPPRHTVGSRHVRIDEGHNIVSHAPGDGDERRSTAASSATTRRGYQPLRYLSYDGMPTMPLGRLKEKERFRLPPCPPYRIPLYDQACMKYIFGDLFRPGMQLMEFFFVGTMILSMFVNLIMTIVNVFFNQRSGVILPWAKTASIIVFSLEFGVVLGLTIFLVIVVAEGIYTHNVGSRLAHDIAAVVTLAGTFSVLRIVGLASPMFPVRRILPLFQNAINLRDYSLAALFLVLWVFAFFIAFISLIVKVTQIEFTFTTSISEWGIVHLIQLVGLLMNLARVDDSYYKEISVLLDATHRHFCIPGEAREADPTVRLALYSRILRKLGVFQYMYFEYFDVIFNYHVKFYQQQELERRRRKKMDALLAKRTQERETAASDAMAGGTSSTAPRHDTSTIGTVNSHNMGSSSRRLSTTVPVAGPAQDDIAQQVPPEELTFGDHLLIMFNYLSFIFEVDAMQLRRYLQMVQSPLPFYQLGRDSFMSSFMERDHVGMDMALWRNDPVASATQEYALEDPDQFFISFECEDRRDIWDVNYAKNAEMEARKKAQAMAEELLSMAAPSQSQIPQSFVPI